MNAGLSNLTDLKAYLLAAALRGGTDYDAAITAIGQGMAARFEKYCNRKFGYQAGDTFVSSADRVHVYLPRYPFITPVTSVEFKSDEVTGWMVQPAPYIVTTNAESGLVYFGAAVGPYWAHLRITYTGGYWFETLEPADIGYPSTIPTGATLLPADLKFAWLMECAVAWKNKDKLGLGIADSENKPIRISMANLLDEFTPQVKGILNQYVRYAMT